MKQWYKVLNVNGVDGKVDGFSFIEANSAEEAEELTYQDWNDDEWEYKDLFVPRAELADYRDVVKLEQRKTVQLFMQDNCTKAEAERHIKAGSEAIKAADWEQYIKDNDVRNADGELLTAEDAKEELGARSVMVDGEKYYLVYVL